jgi:hypothetical protein
MIRFRLVPMLAALLLALAPAVATADAGGWHSEQPPPPADTSIGVPVPLGTVGDIEFWAPNRGLLITGGTAAVPTGLYAYDGTGWYQLSTVCGGHGGRIAWAGPEEWWTIADQPIGQSVTQGLPSDVDHLSLCHFVNGQVVASYAEPIGTPSSYEQMNAAACNGPDDCWFAGERLPGTTNVGAFHLHWDGSTLTAVPSLSTPQPDLGDLPHAVASLAYHQGAFYESVRIDPTDPPTQGESSDQPYLLHELEPGSSNPFTSLFTQAPVDRGPGIAPTDLGALQLSSDGNQLWAVAGANGSAAHVVALLLEPGGFAQVHGAGASVQGDPLVPGSSVAGVAAEPGTDDAWISYAPPNDRGDVSAQLVRLHANGTVDAPVSLPDPADGIARKGASGPVACPAPGQCWMATQEGWLFHLGADLAQDTDPLFHQVITYRPPDDSVPKVPIGPPVDDSGANLPPDQTPPPNAAPPPPPVVQKVPPLISRVSRRMLHRTTLELVFTLRARAFVQLLATRSRRVVARTRRYTLAAGRHSVRLRLNPKRWPTALDLRVTAAPSSRAGTA